MSRSRSVLRAGLQAPRHLKPRRALQAPLWILAASWIAWMGCAETPEVPTATVEQRAFVHRVSAEGALVASDRTVIAVPQDVLGSVRLAWLADEGTLVEAGDVVAIFDRLPMEQRSEDGLDDMAATANKLARVDVEADRDLEGLAKDAEVAELELGHAREYLKTDSQVFSQRDILEDAIDEQLADDRKSHAEEATVVRREVADKERRMLAIERGQAEREVERAKSGLEALEVRAPRAGILTLKRNWQGEPIRVGTELWQGQELAEIPHVDAMEAEVWVLEADAGGLEVGLPAEVRIEAYPETTYPAKIVRMEALAKPKRRGSPLQYFGVTLAFDETDVQTMKPGGRLQATLQLAEREEALVVPRQAVGRNGGEPRVWVRSRDRFEPRSVSLGPVSPGLAVVESGLAAGDVVALAEPPPSLKREVSSSDTQETGGTAGDSSDEEVAATDDATAESGGDGAESTSGEG